MNFSKSTIVSAAIRPAIQSKTLVRLLHGRFLYTTSVAVRNEGSWRSGKSVHLSLYPKPFNMRCYLDYGSR